MENEKILEKIVISIIEANATEKMVTDFISKYKEYPFYAIAVDLNYLSLAKTILNKTGIRLSGVSSYPLGGQTTFTKLKQIEYSVKEGADEIDVSMNYNAIKSGDFKRIEKELKEINNEFGEKIDILMIPQTSILTDEEKIKVFEILLRNNFNMIKLNSGFGWHTKKDDMVLINKEFKNKFSRIDVSGGVRNKEQILEYIDLGADFIHTGTIDSIINEL